jgi:acyl dehydratase
MAIIVTLEQLAEFVGKRLVSQQWLEINQARIDAFADLTEDHQFIHVDPVAARDTPYGGTIAHGYLTLSLLPALLEPIRLQPKGVAWGINYGIDRLRFVDPVPAGARIRATSTLLSVATRAPGQVLTKSEITVDVEHQARPALVVETLVLWMLAADPTARH